MDTKSLYNLSTNMEADLIDNAPGYAITNQVTDQKPIILIDSKEAGALSSYLTDRINVIRSVAMCSVVWGHCLLGLQNTIFTGRGQQLIQSFLMEAGRIGTVLFFMISGYVMNNKINQFNIFSYLRYRLHSIIIPWLIFLTLVVVVQLFQMRSLHQLFSEPGEQLIRLILKLFRASIFHAAFWFIPVALLSSLILVQFKKYIGKLWFGALLAVITLFYCINLFHNWIPANHTQAFLGYVLFLWLGSQIKIHIKLIKGMVEATSWDILIPLILISYALACREGIVLTGLGSVDPYASIRISNIMLSLLLFCFLIKWNGLQWFRKFNPQQNAYGIYLVHTILIVMATPAINVVMLRYNLNSNMPQIIITRLVFFAVVLTSSYLVVRLIKRSSLSFILGRAR